MEKAPEVRHEAMNVKVQRNGPYRGTARERPSGERYLDVVVTLTRVGEKRLPGPRSG